MNLEKGFNKRELREILRAVKILQSGETLLGMDVDKAIVDSIIRKISEHVDKKTKRKTDDEVRQLIKESEELETYEEEVGEEYDFDREFGPNYPYSETLKVINRAITEGKNIKIRYYSASQGEFTEREVRPVNIERRESTPYLNAFCLLRNEDRVFKLGRIKEIKMVG